MTLPGYIMGETITESMAQALADEGREPALIFASDHLEITWPTGTKVVVASSGDGLVYRLER